ncbi:uncharacterized protein LOC143045193 isoform X2 [Mytilus galloprovincialis]|uniref:uncharacterized protein LOC143045193 isoform X2 n=1 Tax=Mytilus galloprovincialis TaxID=29158 RepID=UPI003F7BB6F0
MNITTMDLLSRFVGIWLVFVIYIAVNVEGAVFDATCTGSGVGDCSEANNICVAGTSKCACATTSFRKGGTECATRIVPGATCAAKQCVTHASCNTTSTKCKCDAGYTATPTTKPTMCSGVMKVPTLSYMLAVPIFVSMMSLLR